MKVTGGILKGRNITPGKGKTARYTSSMVRKAIFDIIGDIQGLSVLDIFAGSGTFTIEALSRGASFCTSVEKDGGMAKTLRKNLIALSIERDCLLLTMDARDAIPFLYKRGYKYDIIFMDPPYGQGLIKETMFLFKNYRIYGKDTIFVLEYSKRDPLDFMDDRCFIEKKTRQYGDTRITILKVDTELGSER
ncbi:MAG: 16S rRNA (guanine(966)-N(2))-methyltransferase RsmD [Syntrophorhabdaceae bacterium]|nr:16S rRNA (guanine(966)-N(2))-methyltransferase RsmD [Syntrophorhabdaceae bacterium]